MTLAEALETLERHGDAKMCAQNAKRGAQENQFGVKMGDIRNIAKAIKVDHELGLQLWRTGNLDAQYLSTLVMKPKQLSEEELEEIVSSIAFSQLADWVNTNVVKQHPAKEKLRAKWTESKDAMLQRAAWSLTTERVIKSPDGIDLAGVLDRIERDIAGAPEPAQWNMNYCLAEIGILYPEHRERAIAMGEKFGLYRDYPVSKGCTSPFAPIWIREMVSRQ
jgi:3-methyladenine DNA glycosylase AlkD